MMVEVELVSYSVDPRLDTGNIYADGQYAGTWYVKYKSRGRTVEIQSFAVKEDLRGRGIGRQAFELIRERAERRGYTHFILESLDSNSDEFWEKMGFRFIRGSEALMELDIRKEIEPISHRAARRPVRVRVRQYRRRR